MADQVEPFKYRIMISGSRDLTADQHLATIVTTIESTLLTQDIGDTTPVQVIVGDARGADHLATDYVRQYLPHWTVSVYKADWNKHGRAAGPIRNKEMIVEEQPNILLAFLKGVSPGTRHAITTFDKLIPKPLFRKVVEIPNTQKEK